jgi:hypothetical protein
MSDTGPETVWRTALADGRFLLPHGRRSGRAFFPPRPMEPGTGDAIDWHEASGAGTVHAVTLIHPKPPEPPRAVVLVDLAEGPRLMARVDGIDPASIEIGMAVTAHIVEEAGQPLLAFRPA